MNERTLKALFDIMSNRELLRVKEEEMKFGLDQQGMLLLYSELVEREMIEPDEIVEEWKKQQQSKEETWIVTYLYAPLQRPAVGAACNWGLGTTKLRAKSAADAFARYPDAIKDLQLQDADGSVTWEGPWQISALSIFSIGDEAVVDPDATKAKEAGGE